MKVLVISQGEYSDYGFSQILVAPEGRRIEQDHREFCDVFDIQEPSIGDKPPRRPRAARQEWETRHKASREAREAELRQRYKQMWRELGLDSDEAYVCEDWDVLFAAYLKRLGYCKADVLEINVGAYGRLSRPQDNYDYD